MSTAIPESLHLDLRIVPLRDVLLHERTDSERVRRLMSSIVDSNVLRNPPIVSCIDDDRFVVLDGATRTTALRNLKIEHVVVQVVDYSDNVDLRTWHHLLRPSAYEAILQALPSIPHARVRPCSMDECHTSLGFNGAIAAVASFDDGSALLLETSEPDRTADTLCYLVDLYGGFGEIYRIANDELDTAIRASDDVRGVVLFPSWKPSDIIKAATTQSLLPAGITRHGIHGRALNVNISLDILSMNTDLVSKEQWLESWLRTKLTARKVRYYHEAVFVFDD